MSCQRCGAEVPDIWDDLCADCDYQMELAMRRQDEEREEERRREEERERQAYDQYMEDQMYDDLDAPVSHTGAPVEIAPIPPINMMANSREEVEREVRRYTEQILRNLRSGRNETPIEPVFVDDDDDPDELL